MSGLAIFGHSNLGQSNFGPTHFGQSIFVICCVCCCCVLLCVGVWCRCWCGCWFKTLRFPLRRTPLRWIPPHAGPKNFVFFLSRSPFRSFFSVSGGVFKGPPGFHTPPKFLEKTPRDREKERKGWQESEKSENLGPATLCFFLFFFDDTTLLRPSPTNFAVEDHKPSAPVLTSQPIQDRAHPCGSEQLPELLHLRSRTKGDVSRPCARQTREGCPPQSGPRETREGRQPRPPTDAHRPRQALHCRGRELQR